MKRLMQTIAPLVGLFVFLLALWAMHQVLREIHYSEVRQAIQAISAYRLALAIGLTFLGYGIMTCYDLLAFRYIAQTLPYKKIALTSFVGYAMSNNIGHSFLSGGSVRYRFYSGWGLAPFDIAKVISFCTLTGWAGFMTLGGVSCLLEPRSVLLSAHLPLAAVRPAGALLMGLPLAYLLLCTLRRRPLHVRGLEFPLPTPRFALMQIVVASLDFAVAGAVLYALLPMDVPFSFFAFLGVFMMAMVAGMMSLVPGGLGVFESLMVLLLSSNVSTAHVLGALILFRAIYYLLPLTAGLLLLVAYELRQRRTAVSRLSSTFGAVLYPVLPHIFAFASVICGGILLLSGVTPAEYGRMLVIRALLPLPLVEASHFLGSIAGLAMLLLARGLQRRLDAAYWLTALMLAAGIIFSLVKGFDYEEALILSIMLAALLACRRHFSRKASLFAPTVSPGWIITMGTVIGCSIWLGLFAHKHVNYSHELWWQFSFEDDAPRFMRATVGIVALTLFLSLAKLLRHAPPRLAPPTPGDLECAAGIVRQSPQTSAFLALLGDKHLLFSETRNAFIMYAVQERTWVAMGGPVGPESEARDLIWAFKELCDEHGALAAFYQVGPESVHLYLDAGLDLFKLGEEACVDLNAFSMAGAAHKDDRNLKNKLEKEGYAFEIIPREAVSGVLPELRHVSEEWLRSKNVREKRFSLGNFNEAYLLRFPQALVRKEGKIVAFANILEGADKQELSVDLMRFASSAPPSVMKYLFNELLSWGKEQGYQWFNLGMAPLSGLESRQSAPLWHRLGSLVQRHGEHFYNFQGLRRYKEQFHPVWQPRYLASPGGLVLPGILTNIASLIAGGMTGVVAK